MNEKFKLHNKNQLLHITTKHILITCCWRNSFGFEVFHYEILTSWFILKLKTTNLVVPCVIRGFQLLNLNFQFRSGIAFLFASWPFSYSILVIIFLWYFLLRTTVKASRNWETLSLCASSTLCNWDASSLRHSPSNCSNSKIQQMLWT